MKRLVVIALAAALVGSPVAIGCAPVGVGVRYHAVYVDDEPPPPQDELIPAPPEGDGWVWTDGYWYYTGSSYVWVSGRWRRAPAAGHVWVRPGYVIIDGRYRYVGGRWSAPSRVPRYRYVHPAPRRRYR